MYTPRDRISVSIARRRRVAPMRSRVLQEEGDEFVPRLGRRVLVADAAERQEPSVGDPRGERLAVLEGKERVLRSVDDESRRADVAEASLHRRARRGEEVVRDDDAMLRVRSTMRQALAQIHGV